MSQEHDETSGIVRLGKTIGKAAGKVASMAGVHAAPPAKTASGKLPKKNKQRLPRRQKKALRKAGDVPMM
jgi:hypothetical protein